MSKKAKKQKRTFDVNGYPTRGRLNKAGDFMEPEGPTNRCVIVPPVKPIGYAIKTKKQPLEQALSEAEYRILAFYVYEKINCTGHAGTVDLNNTGGGGYGSKTPFSTRQEQTMRWLGYIDANLAPEHRAVLIDLVNACSNDHELDYRAVGGYLTGSKDLRQQIGGYKGYLKAVAQAILQNDKKYQLVTKNAPMRAISA